MFSLRKVKLRKQLMLLITISMLFILVIEVFYYASISEIIQKRAANYADSILNQLIEKMQTTNEEVKKTTEILSFNKYTQLYLTAETAEQKLPYSNILSETIPYISVTNTQINSISLIGLQGIKTSDHAIQLSSLDYIEKKYNIYDKFSNNDNITDIVKDPLTDLYYYAYVKSVYWSLENTTPFDKIGTCVVQISTKLLETILQGIRMTKNSEFLILDSSNKIVASNNPSVKTGQTIQSDLSSMFSGSTKSLSSKINGRNSLVQSKKIEGSGWSVLSIIPIDEINDELKPIRIIGLFLFIVFSALSIILGVLFNKNMTRPILNLINFLNISDHRNLDQRLRTYERNEIGELSVHINAMLDEIHMMTQKVITSQSSLYEMELAKKQAELSALISQINPHFLYNTLDSLKGIGYHYKIPEIVSITECLSNILRYSIKGSEVVRVKEEIACVRNYLSIISIRFSNRFQFEWSIDDAILDLPMIKFILQPIVENAIYHGLEPKFEAGVLRIKGFILEDQLYFEIIDNGIGMKSDEIEAIRENLKEPLPQSPLLGFGNRGIGISNINNRIKLMHGEEYGIQIESKANTGTTVWIHLPIITKPLPLTLND